MPKAEKRRDPPAFQADSRRFCGCIALLAGATYSPGMNTNGLSTDAMVAEIDAESRKRNVSKSDIVRERLQARPVGRRGGGLLESIADLIGCVDELPRDLSVRKKEYLAATRYGGKRSR